MTKNMKNEKFDSFKCKKTIKKTLLYHHHEIKKKTVPSSFNLLDRSVP